MIFDTSSEYVVTTNGSACVPVPVIASGGGGTPAHLADALTAGKADAALVASMVHNGTYTVGQIKDELNKMGVPMRM